MINNLLVSMSSLDEKKSEYHYSQPQEHQHHLTKDYSILLESGHIFVPNHSNGSSVDSSVGNLDNL